ncbi:MAG: hypothetical protein ABIB47_05850 [Candidatus Woesearchaeota archaeon]
MADTDVLGYWVMYLLIAAVIIYGTYAWIDSFRDGSALENKVVQEDLYFLFSALNNLEGNITVVYAIDDEYDVKKAGDVVFISRKGVVKEINSFDSDLKVFRRGKDLRIEKNE